MPLFINPIEKKILKSMKGTIFPLFDMMGAFSFYAVNSAVELNIFELLNKNSLTAAEISEECKSSDSGIEILMDVLESLGYVKKKAGRYSLTAMSQQGLCSDSEDNISSGFKYYAGTLHELWPHLSKSVKKGNPQIPFYPWLMDHPDVSNHYQEFMHILAEKAKPELLKKITLHPVNEKSNFLDIGGGHGYYSIALSQKYRDSTFTIFDSEYVRTIAEKNASNAGRQEKVIFNAGNYMTDHLGERYDGAMLFNVLHEHSEDENRMLIKKAAEALIPKGIIYILDILKEKKKIRTADYFSKMYSLIFFHTVGGRTYSFEEISGWLENAGLQQIKRINLVQSGVSLITAIK